MTDPVSIRIIVELRTYVDARKTLERVRSALETHPTLSMRCDSCRLIDMAQCAGLDELAVRMGGANLRALVVRYGEQARAAREDTVAAVLQQLREDIDAVLAGGA